MKTRLKKILAAPFVLLAAIFVLFEDWLWDDLLRLAAALGRLLGLRQAEQLIAALPPYGALAAFDVAVATHKKIDLVFHTQVFKLRRDMQKRSRDSASSSPLRQNPTAEVQDETPTYSPTTICGRPAPRRAAAAGAQDRSRTPGGTTCK